MTPEPNSTKRVPGVTLALILANILLAYLASFDPEGLMGYAFNPRSPSLWTASCSLFLHTNLIHLLGNMVFLAAVGPLVERAAGPIKFAAVYVLGGLAGVAVHWALFAARPEAQPVVGASGALAACVGYCSVRYLWLRVPLAPRVSVPVSVVALIWVALQSLGGLVKVGQDTGGMAYWVHLGGFLAGLLLSVAFRAPAQASVQRGHELMDAMGERSQAALLAAAEKHLASHPQDQKALRSKAEALVAMHDHERAAHAWNDLLALVGDDERADVAGKLVACGGAKLLSVTQRLALADRVKAQDPSVSRQLLESALAEDDAGRPDALLQLAGLLDEADPARMQALNELRERYPLHPATQVAEARGLLV